MWIGFSPFKTVFFSCGGGDFDFAWLIAR